MATRFPQPARLATGNSTLDRMQDGLLAALRSITAWAEAYPPRYTTQTLPAASESQAGQLVRVRNNGSAETLRVCLQSADNRWSWVTIATAP